MMSPEKFEETKWMHLSRHVLVPVLERKMNERIHFLLGKFRDGKTDLAGTIGEISALQSLIKTIQQGSDEYEREVQNNG